MSALKSRSHPEAPARLALSFILLLIDCLCVSDGLVCFCFLSSCHVRSLSRSDSQLSSHYWLIFTLSGLRSLGLALRALVRPIIPLPSFFLTPTLLLLFILWGALIRNVFLVVSWVFFLLCRPSNKAKGEIIPEAVSALGG